MAARTLAQAVDIIARRAPRSVALASPFQPGRFASLDYGALSDTSARLAAALNARFDGRARPGSMIVSDLPNVAENLVLQLACSRLGVAIATAKDAKVLAKLDDADASILGAVTADPDGFLAGAPLEAHIDDDELSALLDATASPAADEPVLADAHAYFNSPTPLTNAAILAQGADAAANLGITEDDRVCVSITLCHAFGIGSACAGAFLSGAAVVLPAVGGIRGCGVPSQRAEATRQTLADEQCTLLFADTHTLKALPADDAGADLRLRGGVVKIGSGTEFLDETREFAGVTLATLGKKGGGGGHGHGHSHGGGHGHSHSHG